MRYYITINIFRRKDYISLGGNCSIAYQLNKNKLRHIAFPFDWCRISLNQLILVFNNKFEDYNSIYIHKYSTIHPSIETNNKGSYIVKNKNNIEFAHELLQDDPSNIDEMKDKILKRIQRLIDYKSPTFIRLETRDEKPDKYKLLLQILDKYYTNYKLIVISRIPINHSRIEWIQLKEYSEDWKYNYIKWNELLMNY
jgi:hypothetical protein